MKPFSPKTAEVELVTFIQSVFASAHFAHAVIGVSGGIDSATSLALAVRALGKERVFPILMPYGELNSQGVVDGMLAIRWLHIAPDNITQIDIQPYVDPIISMDGDMDEARKGNIMARMRMILLFDQAKKRKALVVGTENKSEHLLGYFTRFGDEASDLEPLQNLYKTQVYALARHMGMPEPLMTKAPTAGLWPGQTDEGEFGFDYAKADEILSAIYDDHMAPERLISNGIDKQVLKRVMQRVKENEFKHKLPYAPKGSSVLLQ